jgi:RNA polymerase sigma-70 factor (ECF subfamily)
VTAAIRESGALTDAASCAQRQEQLRLLGAALDQLEDRQRLAIHLYYLEPDPVRAAESALGLSRSGYYKLLARARERLVELMSMKLPS